MNTNGHFLCQLRFSKMVDSNVSSRGYSNSVEPQPCLLYSRISIISRIGGFIQRRMLSVSPPRPRQLTFSLTFPSQEIDLPAVSRQGPRAPLSALDSTPRPLSLSLSFLDQRWSPNNETANYIAFSNCLSLSITLIRLLFSL